MEFVFFVVVALGLSMDSFALSAQKSLNKEVRGRRIAVTCAFWFALCQASLVLSGYLLGKGIAYFFELSADGCTEAVIALALAAAYMFFESFTVQVNPENDGIDVMSMVVPAFAASLDGLLIGILLLWMSIPSAIIIILTIGFVPAGSAVVGVWVGRKKGMRFNRAVQVIGAVLLAAAAVLVVLKQVPAFC